MFDIMKGIRHGPLESGPNIFKAKGYLAISKRLPEVDEGRLVLDGWECIDLIVAKKNIHK